MEYDIDPGYFHLLTFEISSLQSVGCEPESFAVVNFQANTVNVSFYLFVRMLRFVEGVCIFELYNYRTLSLP